MKQVHLKEFKKKFLRLFKVKINWNNIENKSLPIKKWYWVNVDNIVTVIVKKNCKLENIVNVTPHPFLNQGLKEDQG